MIRYAAVIALASLPLASLAAQSDEGPPRWAANIARKQQVVMSGVPRPYAGRYDRTADGSAKLRRGRQVFQAHCESCHGWSGEGNGPDAFAQVPAPADLEWLAHTPKRAAQPYMYWTISEGGRAFGSEMPAFKEKLGGPDIWAVIAYIRAGMPRRSP
jgi:mono/diheme cytochrome c family protein